MNKQIGVPMAGAAALALAMGVGRFAYTPILPLMKGAFHFSDAFASALASTNYFGYLIGAIVASHAWLRARRLASLWGAAAASIVLTAAMASTAAPALWIGLRFASGVASAIAFVYASSLVLDGASSAQRNGWAGILYSGVGFGIALSATVMLGIAPLDARVAWLSMAGLGVLLAVPLACGLRPNASENVRAPSSAGRLRASPHFAMLLTAYFAEGFGYIIPATFIVLMTARVPALHPYAGTSWILVGLAAIPSIPLWRAAADRVGRWNAAAAAMILQAAGMLVPLALPTPAGLAIGAISLGGTFVPITSMLVGIGRDLFPRQSASAIAVMTLVYGVGQILGPLLVAFLETHGGSYAQALYAAGALLTVAAAVSRFAAATEQPGGLPS